MTITDDAVLRHFRYRLAPTPSQADQFAQFAGVCRLVWNLALECRETSWREHVRNTGHQITAYSQSRELTQLRAEYDWIAAVPRVALEATLADLETAFRNFFAGRARYPKPKKKGVHDAFRVRSHELRSTRLNGKWSAFWVPKVGWVKYRDTRHIDNDIRHATIVREAGNWYISVLTTTDRANAAPSAEIGIDRGVANTLSLSTGEHYSVPASLTALERRQRRLKHDLARKTRGSRRYRKQRRRAAAVSARCARIRRDWHHRITTEIARRYDHVAIEALKTTNMTAAGPRKRGLNRSILNQGWGTFEALLAYKLEERGGTLIKVTPAFTSQTCSACGTIDRESRESQASFVCRHCGFEAHADTNAAINILRASSPWTPVEVAEYRADEAGTGGGPTAENHGEITP